MCRSGSCSFICMFLICNCPNFLFSREILFLNILNLKANLVLSQLNILLWFGQGKNSNSKTRGSKRTRISNTNNTVAILLPISGTLSCVMARLEVVATNPVAKNRADTRVFNGSLGISSPSSSSSVPGCSAGRSILTGADGSGCFFLFDGDEEWSPSPSESERSGDRWYRRCKYLFIVLFVDRKREQGLQEGNI